MTCKNGRPRAAIFVFNEVRRKSLEKNTARVDELGTVGLSTFDARVDSVAENVSAGMMAKMLGTAFTVVCYHHLVVSCPYPNAATWVVGDGFGSAHLRERVIKRS